MPLSVGLQSGFTGISTPKGQPEAPATQHPLLLRLALTTRARSSLSGHRQCQTRTSSLVSCPLPVPNPTHRNARELCLPLDTMVRLREIPRTAAFAWSPGAAQPLLVTGTRAGAVDADFSDETKLELWQLSLDNQDQGLELQPLTSISTDSR